MTEAKMPGLAQLIEHNKQKSHIIQSILNTSLKEDQSSEAVDEPCPVLHEAIGQLRADQLRREQIPDAIAGHHDLLTGKHEHVGRIASSILLVAIGEHLANVAHRDCA